MKSHALAWKCHNTPLLLLLFDHFNLNKPVWHQFSKGKQGERPVLTITDQY